MAEADAAGGKEIDAGKTILDGDKGSAAADNGINNSAVAGGDAAKSDAVADAAKADSVDWRARLAGDDKDALKRLARFSDEAAFYKSYRALEGKLSSGEMKRALPENASDEERATWRKENGIPENEAGYLEKLALPNGLVIGEADKPVVTEIAKAALAGNIDPAAFNGIVSKYYELQDAQIAKRDADDVAYKLAAEDELRQAWEGQDYRRNLTAVSNMMAGWPHGLAAAVLAARDPDTGRKMGDNPAFIRQMAALAVELNPIATLVPAGTSDPGKTAAAELEGIREMRRNDPAKYEADKKLQARELELIEATLKVQNRAA